MNFKDWFRLCEMPIELKFHGDWEDALEKTKKQELNPVYRTTNTLGQPEKGIHGWGASSIKYLTDEKNKAKIIRLWQNVPQCIVANMVMWDKSKTKTNYLSYSQYTIGNKNYGEITKDKLDKLIGKSVDIYSDKINVFYLNNIGDSAIPMTGHIIAHRLAHCFFDHDKNDPLYPSNMDMAIVKLFSNFLKENYNKLYNNNELWNDAASELSFNSVTTKAGREKKIRGHDWLHELFAQYLLKRKITFPSNQPPKEFSQHLNYDDNHTWQDTVYLKVIDYNKAKIEYQKLTKLISDIFEQVIQRALGKIYII